VKKKVQVPTTHLHFLCPICLDTISLATELLDEIDKVVCDGPGLRRYLTDSWDEFRRIDYELQMKEDKSKNCVLCILLSSSFISLHVILGEALWASDPEDNDMLRARVQEEVVPELKRVLQRRERLDEALKTNKIMKEILHDHYFGSHAP